MTTQHIETLIIGAGQAGLSTGYHLQRLGRPFLIVDGNERIGDNWRQQWDTLRLYTPAKYDGLPGLPSRRRRGPTPARTTSPTTWRSTPSTPTCRSGCPLAVDRLEARPGRRVHRGRSAADTITCDNVVVATGSFGRTPNVPDFAAELDPSIRQLHSSEYRRPGQLATGRCWWSAPRTPGCDIAYEVAEHLPTTLVGRDRGQIPLRVGLAGDPLRASRSWSSCGATSLTRRTPIGRKEMDEIRHHGGPMLRVKRADLERRGVVRCTSGSRASRRPAAARRRHGRRRGERRLVHRVPAGLRLDRPAGLRRGRLAGGVPRGRGRRARAVLLRVGLPVRLQLDGPAGRRPRRGVRRRPDRRARRPSPRPPWPDRATTAGRPSAILRGRVVRDGRGRRPGPGSAGLRTP